MKIVCSYKVAILPSSKIPFSETIALYRKAASYLIDVFYKEWDSLSAVSGTKRKALAERLIHSTAHNTAKYDFDKMFYKLPSYFRRAVQNSALGAVSSYMTNHAKWEKSHEGKEPTLQCERDVMPVFYNTHMYRTESTGEHYVKLYHKGDWHWFPIRLRATDMKYIEKYWSHCRASAPTLEKHYGRYYLRFAFEEKIPLSKTPIQKQRICSVDLGLNTDAVCSIMDSTGTILDRKFIDFESDKDQLGHLLNRIKRQQKNYGPKSLHGLWSYTRRLNDELAIKIATAITEYAVLNSVDTIVFEHLDFKGKKKHGTKAQKLTMWKHGAIQKYVMHKAHRCGIHISRICARNTSSLAYDGSGTLTRDPKNHALAKFQNGKSYNCDLSASYNIGARYFIRELLKSAPVKERSQLLAEVPEAERRTSCTLSSLWKLNEALKAA